MWNAKLTEKCSCYIIASTHHSISILINQLIQKQLLELQWSPLKPEVFRDSASLRRSNGQKSLVSSELFFILESIDALILISYPCLHHTWKHLCLLCPLPNSYTTIFTSALLNSSLSSNNEMCYNTKTNNFSPTKQGLNAIWWPEHHLCHRSLPYCKCKINKEKKEGVCNLMHFLHLKRISSKENVHKWRQSWNILPF